MVITAHIALAIGINSGLKVSLPAAFFIGFISHYFADALPHTDTNCIWREEDREKSIMPLPVKIFILADFLISFILLAWLWWLGKNPWFLFLSSAGAILPDIISVAIPFWFPAVKKLQAFNWHKQFKEFIHYYSHKQQPGLNENCPPADGVNWQIGLISTILILGLSLYLLF